MNLERTDEKKVSAADIRKRIEEIGQEQVDLEEAYPEALRQEAEAARDRIIAGWKEVEQGIQQWQECQALATEAVGPFSSQALLDIKSKMLNSGTNHKVFTPAKLGDFGSSDCLDE